MHWDSCTCFITWELCPELGWWLPQHSVRKPNLSITIDYWRDLWHCHFNNDWISRDSYLCRRQRAPQVVRPGSDPSCEGQLCWAGWPGGYPETEFTKVRDIYSRRFFSDLSHSWYGGYGAGIPFYHFYIQRWAVRKLVPQICGRQQFRFVELPQMWHFADSDLRTQSFFHLDFGYACP